MLLDHILFAIRLYHENICHQAAPSNVTLHLAPNPHPNITLLLHHQKSRILNPSEKPNRASSSLSPLPVASYSECPRATSVATNFSHRGVKETPRSSTLLRLVCRATWPRYGGSEALVFAPRANRRLMLVLFHRLSSICKTIRLFEVC